MNTIIFNNENSFQVESYSKTTNFDGVNVYSNATATLVSYGADSNALNGMVNQTITSIKIVSNGNTIYEITDLNVEINSITEYLSGDHMSINLNMIFK